jgi:hypothetical protein
LVRFEVLTSSVKARLILAYAVKANSAPPLSHPVIWISSSCTATSR